MKTYQALIQRIFDTGVRKPTRTGVDTIAMAGAMFEHDMKEGFPLLTTKKVPFKLPAIELEFFLHGRTDKAWLQERKNHIWDEWCAPHVVPYGHDEETKARMREERELGPIYGFQWRHFGAEYVDHATDYAGQGVDQILNLLETLKRDPMDRRMIVNAWNPAALHQMALPPCYYGFQVTVLDGKLNVLWNQRSVDAALGLPFDIVVHGLLLHLLAKEAGLEEGRLVGFLGDVHIYENHVDGLKEQLTRTPTVLPRVTTPTFTTLLDWKHTDTQLESYEHAPSIKFDIAV